jgi:hypothetical protein
MPLIVHGIVAVVSAMSAVSTHDPVVHALTAVPVAALQRVKQPAVSEPKLVMLAVSEQPPPPPPESWPVAGPVSWPGMPLSPSVIMPLSTSDGRLLLLQASIPSARTTNATFFI